MSLYCTTPSGTYLISCDTDCCCYSDNNPSNPYCCSCGLFWYWILVICVACVIFVISIVCICCACCKRRKAIILANNPTVVTTNGQVYQAQGYQAQGYQAQGYNSEMSARQQML